LHVSQASVHGKLHVCYVSVQIKTNDSFHMNRTDHSGSRKNDTEHTTKILYVSEMSPSLPHSRSLHPSCSLHVMTHSMLFASCLFLFPPPFSEKTCLQLVRCISKSTAFDFTRTLELSPNILQP